MIFGRIGIGFTLLGLTCAAALALGPALAQPTRTVRMWTFLNPTGNAPRERALAQIIANFEVKNPGVKVVVEPQVFDQMTPKFLAAHRTGSAPDVIWVITDLLGDTIRSGALADLNELFIKNWVPSQVADRKDAYWERCTVGGKLYCLFTSRNYIALIYRSDFLRAAGIDPKKLTTWEAFIEAAQKLTVKDTAGNVTRYGFGQAFSENQADPQMMVPILLAKQGNLFDETGRARFATPAGVEALQLQSDMVTKYGVTPKQAATWTVDDLYEQFAASRLAIITGASVRVSTLQAKVGKENVGMMLWPGVDGKPHSPAVMAGWAVGVWSGSRVKDLAGRFVEYMTGPEADKLWVQVGGQTPSLASTRRVLADFFRLPENQYLVVAAEGSRQYGWLAPIDYSIGGYRQVLNKAAQRVIIDGIDPKAALEEAERDFNRRNNR